MKKFAVAIALLLLVVTHSVAMAEYSASQTGIKLLEFFQVDINIQPREHLTKGKMLQIFNALLGISETDTTTDQSSPVSYSEFAKGLVDVLGYSEPAKFRGYTTYIHELRILDKIDAGLLENVSLKDVPIIMENIFKVSYYSPTSIGENTNYTTQGGLLEVVHGIHKVEGRITSVETTSLYSEQGCGKNRIKIGDEYYFYAESNSNILGRYVDAYFKEKNSINEIITLSVRHADNREISISIDAKNNPFFVNNTLTFGNRNKLILSNMASVIYNQKFDLDYNLVNINNISFGEMTVLDIDTDGTYDIVFIDEYANYLVAGVIDGVLYDKRGMQSLDLNVDVLRVYKNMRPIPISEIKEWDVASVYASNSGCVIRIEISDKAAYRYISESQIMGNYLSVKLGDSVHMVYLGNDRNPELNVTDWGKFFFDAYGRVAGVELKSNRALYGYLTATDSEALVGKGRFKILTDTGKYEVFEAVDKIFLNQARDRSSQVATLLENNPQLISYKINDTGQLTHIDTVGGGIEAKAGNIAARYRASAKVFGSKYIVGDNTIIFGFSNNAENTTEPATIMSPSDFSSEEGTYSGLSFYDVDQFGIAGAIVYMRHSNNTAMSKDVYFITKVVTAATEDGDILEKVYFKHNAAESFAYANYDASTLAAKGKIQPGQCVRMSFSSIGDIADFDILFTDPSINSFLDTNYSGDTSLGAGGELVCSYGTISKIGERSFAIHGSEYVYLNSPSVRCYNYSGARERFENSSYFTLKEGDRVFVVKRYDLVTDIVII